MARHSSSDRKSLDCASEISDIPRMKSPLDSNLANMVPIQHILYDQSSVDEMIHPTGLAQPWLSLEGHLCTRFEEECHALNQNFRLRVLNNLKFRLQTCLKFNGGHIEQIL